MPARLHAFIKAKEGRKLNTKICLLRKRKCLKCFFFSTWNVVTVLTPTLEKGKHCLYLYFHGSCAPLRYKYGIWVIFDPAVKNTVTESVTKYKTHTHTHTHGADWSQTELKLSGAGVPSPFPDPVLDFQRSKFKQFHTQPSKRCLPTLVHQSVSGGRGRPLSSPCCFLFFTFDYYWKCLQEICIQNYFCTFVSHFTISWLKSKKYYLFIYL